MNIILYFMPDFMFNFSFHLSIYYFNKCIVLMLKHCLKEQNIQFLNI